LLNNRLHSSLGIQLKALRKSADLTQKTLASQSGFSIPTIIKAEKGAGALASFTTLANLLGHEITGRSLPNSNSLGESLGLLRQRQKLSLRSLSELTDVSVPTIMGIEANRPCNLYPVERIGATLNAGLCLNHIGQALAFYSSAATSSNFQAWTTPPDILERLYPVVGGIFDLDPCSPTTDRKKAPVKAKVYHTGDEGNNGLLMPWFGNVFVNPPYGRELKIWIKKCHDEYYSGRVKTCIALIPARPDTNAWHQYIADKADVFMLRGRLKFGADGGGEAAPFPSAIVVWNADPIVMQSMKSAFPNAWHVAI
jgi:transcriptional regulator with XRE-family HTH domain